GGKCNSYYSVFHSNQVKFLFTFVVLCTMFVCCRTKPVNIGFASGGMIVLKLFAALLFLWPLITLEDVFKVPDLCSFFAPYFIFLLIEVLLTIKVLRLTYDHS